MNLKKFIISNLSFIAKPILWYKANARKRYRAGETNRLLGRARNNVFSILELQNILT